MKVEIEYLRALVHKQLKEKYGENVEFSLKQIGKLLCGDEWKLAKRPLSQEFLEHVSFNERNSYHAVLYLQLVRLETNTRLQYLRKEKKIY